MGMNLSPLLETSVRQLQQQLVAQAEAASLATELKVGRVLSALVAEISTLTDAERQEALQRLQQQLASGKQGGEPDTRAQLKEWLRHSQLHLVTLKVASRQVHALTTSALELQQAVKVLVRSDGQLQLLPGSAGEASQGAAKGAPATTTASLQALLNHTYGKPSSTTAQPQIETIADSLRSSLPKQQSLKALIQLLGKLDSVLASIPSQSRNELVPPPLQRALAQIQSQSYTPEQLSQPDVLRQALRQNGILYEAKVAAHYEGKLAGHYATRLATHAGKHTSAPATSTSAPARALGNSSLTLAPADGVTPQAAPPTAESDMKAALLQALQLVQTKTAPASTQPGAPKPALAQDTLILSLLGLLQKDQVRQKNVAEVKGQLLQALQQQLTASLAKVQTQQLQSLNPLLSDGAAPQGGHFEIPVRWPEGYGSINIHIQEYWNREPGEDSGNSEERRETEKAHQWEVFLEFDLDGYGQLASQLKIINGVVSASFWAESAGTRALATERMAALRQQMEDSGLQVKDMQCLAGQPPRRNMKLNYNLVDVTT